MIGEPVAVGAVTTPVEPMVDDATPEDVATDVATELARVTDEAGHAYTVTVTGASEELTETPAEVETETGGGT